MSCAEKSWRLTRELRRQFRGSIFNAFLASTQWPSSVAGCRAVESLGRTYAKKLKIAHFAGPRSGVPKLQGNRLRVQAPAQYRRFPPAATRGRYPTVHCQKSTDAIVTRIQLRQRQENLLRWRRPTKQGPDPCQNFGPALHKFAGPKLGPKTAPETGPPLLRDKARSEFGDLFWSQN